MYVQFVFYLHSLAHATTALLASKIPLYVEAPPGPGSLDVIRRAFANGHKDFLTPDDKDYKTISGEPEIIEITSSSPSDASVALRRTRSKVKKEKSPDAPLLRASKKRATKKSKEIITDSEEISDDDDIPKHTKKKGKFKATATAQTTMKDIKGKGKAVSAKNHQQDKVTPIDVDAQPATQAIPPVKRKLASPPIPTEANLGPPTANPKVVFRPISDFIAHTQAIAAAEKAKTVTDAQGVAMASATTTIAKPTPRPIKKQTVSIWDSGDPFLVKPSVSSNEGHLQGPAHPGQAPISNASMATHKKPSAFGPPRHPSTAPPALSNPSKRAAEGEKVINVAAAKKLGSALKSPSPGGNVGAQALQESSGGERMTAEESAASSSAQPAATTSAQGYQWPYGPYYPPFGFPPGAGWNYPSWNQDHPAGSAGETAPAFPFPPHPTYPSWNQDRPAGSAGETAPAFPFPPHPMMPFPGFYPSGAGAAANTPTVPAKPAEGEPGPSRST